MRKVYDFTENVLIVLYILQRAGIGLTQEQLTGISMDAAELNYIDVALAVDHLKEQQLLSERETPTGIYYLPTIEGRRVMGHFISSIRGSIRERIESYLSENMSKLHLEAELTNDYVPVGDGTYLVVLRAYEKNQLLSEIALFAADMSEANLLTEHWKERAGEVNAAVYKILSREDS